MLFRSVDSGNVLQDFGGRTGGESQAGSGQDKSDQTGPHVEIMSGAKGVRQAAKAREDFDKPEVLPGGLDRPGYTL